MPCGTLGAILQGHRTQVPRRPPSVCTTSGGVLFCVNWPLHPTPSVWTSERLEAPLDAGELAEFELMPFPPTWRVRLRRLIVGAPGGRILGLRQGVPRYVAGEFGIVPEGAAAFSERAGELVVPHLEPMPTDLALPVFGGLPLRQVTTGAAPFLVSLEGPLPAGTEIRIFGRRLDTELRNQSDVAHALAELEAFQAAFAAERSQAGEDMRG